LRQRVCDLLKKNVPANGVTSDDPRFMTMTSGTMNSKILRDNWRKGGMLTSCNAFAGWVARQIGAKAPSPLAAGALDLSSVAKQVPGSWVVNDADALQANLHPRPGDFYCSSLVDKTGKVVQKFAHVGIVVEFDERTQVWKWVAGGQGGPATSPNDLDKAVDIIKWGPGNAQTFLQARSHVVGWVDIGVYFYPPNPNDDSDDGSDDSDDGSDDDSDDDSDDN